MKFSTSVFIRTQTEGVREQGAEGDTWAQEGRRNRGMEKTT